MVGPELGDRANDWPALGLEEGPVLCRSILLVDSESDVVNEVVLAVEKRRNEDEKATVSRASSCRCPAP